MVVDGRLVRGVEPALDYYRERTGLIVDPASIDYYRRLYGLFLVLMSQSAAHKLERGDRFCRLTWVASEILHRAQSALGMAIGIAQAAKPVPGQLG